MPFRIHPNTCILTTPFDHGQSKYALMGFKHLEPALNCLEVLDNSENIVLKTTIDDLQKVGTLIKLPIVVILNDVLVPEYLIYFWHNP